MTGPARDDDHVDLRLGLYVLDALPPDEHRAVARHLAGCAACRRLRAELARVRAALDRLTPPELAALEAEFDHP
jgi:anti-sigma factor RsiW